MTGMELMMQAAINAMIARMSPGELEQFKTLVKSGADALAKLDQLQANQIAMMRHIGMTFPDASTPEKDNGIPAGDGRRSNEASAGGNAAGNSQGS